MAKPAKRLSANLNYKEGEVVEHINGVWPSFLTIELVCSVTVTYSAQGEELHPGIKSAAYVHMSASFQTTETPYPA